MSTVSVTYKAPKDDNKVVEMGGHTFFDGQAAKLDSEKDFAILAKLRSNWHFKVTDKTPVKVAEPEEGEKPNEDAEDEK